MESNAFEWSSLSDVVASVLADLQVEGTVAVTAAAPDA